MNQRKKKYAPGWISDKDCKREVRNRVTRILRATHRRIHFLSSSRKRRRIFFCIKRCALCSFFFPSSHSQFKIKKKLFFFNSKVACEIRVNSRVVTKRFKRSYISDNEIGLGCSSKLNLIHQIFFVFFSFNQKDD